MRMRARKFRTHIYMYNQTGRAAAELNWPRAFSRVPWRRAPWRKLSPTAADRALDLDYSQCTCMWDLIRNPDRSHLALMGGDCPPAERPGAANVPPEASAEPAHRCVRMARNTFWYNGSGRRRHGNPYALSLHMPNTHNMPTSQPKPTPTTAKPKQAKARVAPGELNTNGTFRIFRAASALRYAYVYTRRGTQNGRGQARGSRP